MAVCLVMLLLTYMRCSKQLLQLTVNLTFIILNLLHLIVSFGRTESQWLKQNSPDSELRVAKNKKTIFMFN